MEVGAGVGDLTDFFIKKNCAVLATEARAANVTEYSKRHPQYRIEIADLDVPNSHDKFGTFDIVFCYGVLYHLSNPAQAIKDMTNVCKKIMLLETCVSYIDNGQLNPVNEHTEWADQSVHGIGCRPARNWVLAELKKYMAHVYITATQPNFPEDFPIIWPSKPKGLGLARSIFVGSRDPINNPLLLTTLPAVQTYA